MATMKHTPKKPKSRPGGRRQGIRNAIGRRRSRSTPRAHTAPTSPAIRSHLAKPDVAKMGIGALGGAALCALSDYEDWLPPLATTAVMAATGATLALADRTTRMIGIGLVGGALLERAGAGIVASYEHKDEPQPHAAATNAAATGAKATSPPAPAPPADTRQSSFEGFGLPPGALESAYQRARERLAMEAAIDPSR